ncbi:inorganic diphosphatase [Bifidobacterium magnum]|uniref:Inorganic pyrophosphatase n=1 Tax=Bifidobacterium magnum TaxID=1692 RepID=A0A087BEU8_9BIFI|nr:inorganic diphosphatase [Bifidobacterium magnum]KFI69548.1 Inorganic pyrophosphatase [Bifidobacterium magnum]
MAETFNVVVEIPRGSKNKYEVDQASGRVFLDRTLFTSMGYPDDYGYIDGTLGEDGDPLDALVMIPNSVFPGCIIECRAVGLYHMVDEEGGDDKVLCVPADVRFDDIKDISDVSSYHKDEIKHFFEQYKALEPGKEVMPGDYWADAATANKEIEEAHERLAKSLKAEEKRDETLDM